jgi:hypothetical protein
MKRGRQTRKVRTPHITSFATFNTTLPKEANEEKEGGDIEEEEAAAMDEADEEQ